MAPVYFFSYWTKFRLIRKKEEDENYLYIPSDQYHKLSKDTPFSRKRSNTLNPLFISVT